MDINLKQYQDHTSTILLEGHGCAPSKLRSRYPTLSFRPCVEVEKTSTFTGTFWIRKLQYCGKQFVKLGWAFTKESVIWIESSVPENDHTYILGVLRLEILLGNIVMFNNKIELWIMMLLNCKPVYSRRVQWRCKLFLMGKISVKNKKFVYLRNLLLSASQTSSASKIGACEGTTGSVSNIYPLRDPVTINGARKNPNPSPRNIKN